MERVDNRMQIFKSQLTEGKELRVFGTPEKPLFVAKDVAKFLEYPNKNPPELRAFSTEEYTGMLKIDGRYYPTIQHYIIASLISKTGIRRVVVRPTY